MTVPWGRSSRRASCSAHAWPRHWNTTSAPRSPAAWRHRVLRTTAGSSASGSRVSRPSASATCAALRGRVDHDHRGRAVAPGEQGGEQTDHAGADDGDAAAAYPVAEVSARRCRAGRRRRAAARWRRSVPCARRRRRASDRGRPAAGRTGRRAGRRVPGAVAVRHRDDRAHGDGRGTALHHPPDLHVAEPGHRVRGARLAGLEQPELGVPGDVQIGVGALDVAQLGAGGHAAEQRLDPERARDAAARRPARQLDPAAVR